MDEILHSYLADNYKGYKPQPNQNFHNMDKFALLYGSLNDKICVVVPQLAIQWCCDFCKHSFVIIITELQEGKHFCPVCGKEFENLYLLSNSLLS